MLCILDLVVFQKTHRIKNGFVGDELFDFISLKDSPYGRQPNFKLKSGIWKVQLYIIDENINDTSSIIESFEFLVLPSQEVFKTNETFLSEQATNISDIFSIWTSNGICFNLKERTKTGTTLNCETLNWSSYFDEKVSKYFY